MSFEFVASVMKAGVFAAVAIAVVLTVNRKISARPLPSEKPGLAFFPKYYIDLPTDAGRADGLEAAMTQKGFRAVENKSGGKSFERGSVLGDLSIDWVKLRISEMEGSPGRLLIAYGGPALFDTGDLWKFAREIERILSSGD